MGDLVGAAGVVLTTVPDAITVCLAGHSARAMQQLEQGYGAERRVRVLGFSEQMPELLAAADALIHTTGGTTALEARVVGCRLINYGTSVAHVRAHARAMAAQGLAEWAPDRAALAPALVRTLSAPRPAPLAVDALPKASDLVVRLALGEPPRSGGERFGGRTRDVAELGPRLGA